MQTLHGRRVGSSSPIQAGWSVGLGLALAATLASVPSSAFARTADGQGSARVELRGPVQGTVENEPSAMLRWTADSRASEYVVFVSRAPVANRAPEALLTDPQVAQRTVRSTEIQLQDVVRGPAGRTLWYWGVATRDRETGRLALVATSEFSAEKTFERRSAPTSLIQAVGRGRLSSAPIPARSEIQLQGGRRFDPIADGEPPIVSSLMARPVPAGGTGSYIVQVRHPVEAGERERIEAAGGSIFAYLPENAFLVRMPSSARAGIEAMPFVRWVGQWHPAYKLSAAPAMSLAGPQIVTVLLFNDAGLAAVRASIEAMGATVLEASETSRNKILRFRIDSGRLGDVAGLSEIAWIEPWAPSFAFNNICQWVVQTNVSNSRRVWDMGIHGEGQVVHISDSGVRSSHNAFRDAGVTITTFGDYPTHRKIIAYKPAPSAAPFGDHSGASYHGTHTSGTIAGDDSPFATDARDGHALKAKLYFHDIGAFSDTVYAPSDLGLLFGPAYAGNAGGAARISSNSWGSPVNEYDIRTMIVDQFMSDHKDFLVCFASGNTAGPGTCGSPGTMKNGITCGATQNGTNAGIKASFSSEGPASDGRRKPTVVAPGDGQTPLSGISSAYGANDTGYQSLLGTSMATPAIAGASALVRQYFTDGWYPSGVATPANAFNPSAALVKAMDITSTDNDMTGPSIPNTQVGWGRIKLDNILFFPGDTRRTAVVDETNGLATGEYAEYQVNVTDASVPLKITLVWTDHEGSPTAGLQLVNNLDLVVTDPGNLAYQGNAFAGGESQLGGAPDLINVEEGVRRNTPVLGKWKIRVSAPNVPFGPQPFAVVVSGGVAGPSGVVLIDKRRYGRSDQIEVRVEDLNVSGPSVAVSLSSTTESTAEILTANGGAGVFTRNVPTTAFSPVNGDGKLSVSQGDSIIVTYLDGNPAGNVSVGATADFEGPIVTNVRAADEGVAQRVSWNTNVIATSRVYYGITTALGLVSPDDPAVSTLHGVALYDLVPETQYFYDVESLDRAGNVTRDNNAGSHYSFVTNKRGEILVVVGDDGTFTDDTLYTQALQNRGWLPALLKGGTIGNPTLGNRNVGLRSYRAVWWQPGKEQYPPFEDAARDSLTAYLNGGGRLAVCGHDVAWALADPTSGFSNAARAAWVQNTLHEQFLEDPLSCCASIQGIASDPISNDYTAGIPYAPHRAGAATDEVNVVNGTGTGAVVWRNTDATPGNSGIRWVNGVPNGNPLDALWGGAPSRLVMSNFEWTGIVDATTRADVLDKTIRWLIGNDHPDAAVTGPNGGEILTTSPVSIGWTETPFGGATIASRSLHYSADGGASWQLIATGVGPSPYSWNVGAIPNGSQYRVRVTVTDNGTPALTGQDASDANFTLSRTGGDLLGPKVIAGSIRMSPNPMDNQNPATLFATLTDIGSGESNIAAAEFSVGSAPLAAGTGRPMTGAFNASTLDVSGAITPLTVARGERTFWVRGRDDKGNWGPASGFAFVVNGNPTVDVAPGGSLAFRLGQNAPNPFRLSTLIHFTLPRASDVKLEVYSVTGERIRTLMSGKRAAGPYHVGWDGRSEGGQEVGSGVYFYRLVAGRDHATRKMIFMR